MNFCRRRDVSLMPQDPCNVGDATFLFKLRRACRVSHPLGESVIDGLATVG